MTHYNAKFTSFTDSASEIPKEVSQVCLVLFLLSPIPWKCGVEKSLLEISSLWCPSEGDSPLSWLLSVLRRTRQHQFHQEAKMQRCYKGYKQRAKYAVSLFLPLTLCELHLPLDWGEEKNITAFGPCWSSVSKGWIFFSLPVLKINFKNSNPQFRPAIDCCLLLL